MLCPIVMSLGRDSSIGNGSAERGFIVRDRLGIVIGTGKLYEDGLNSI